MYSILTTDAWTGPIKGKATAGTIPVPRKPRKPKGAAK